MNCRRVQSLLSAYIDGELTGEEMIAIRSHMSHCEFCTDEYDSLLIVKRLLGTLQSAEAKDEWQSSVSACAYAGGRPWWEKTIASITLTQYFSTSPSSQPLTPRGVRMARALALSAAVVFLAASPFATHERLDQGVTGRMAAGMGFPLLNWASDQRTRFAPISSVFQPQDDYRGLPFAGSGLSAGQRYAGESASTIAMVPSSTWSDNGSLTFVSAGEK